VSIYFPLFFEIAKELFFFKKDKKCTSIRNGLVFSFFLPLRYLYSQQSCDWHRNFGTLPFAIENLSIPHLFFFFCVIKIKKLARAWASVSPCQFWRPAFFLIPIPPTPFRK
jgi:hypothetical protein